MSDNRCTIAPEMLAALVRGELPADAARELEQHAGRCATCQNEVAWLRAEQELFGGRAAAAPTPPPAVWQAIERRTGIARARARKRWALGAGAFALVASAALTLAVCRPPRQAGPSGTGPNIANIGGGGDAGQLVAPAPGPAPAPPVPVPAEHDGDRALAQAEHELDDAIANLQAEYARKLEQMPPAQAQRTDEKMTKARTAVDEARRHAGDDPAARRRLLRARARYMHTMQEVVLAPAQPALPGETPNGEQK
jgi:hypothetical protein